MVQSHAKFGEGVVQEQNRVDERQGHVRSSALHSEAVTVQGRMGRANRGWQGRGRRGIGRVLQAGGGGGLGGRLPTASFATPFTLLNP